MQRIQTQDEWIERARNVLPAGGFGNFDPNIVIRNGKGSRVWDENGNEYIDYLIGSGPMLLGHGHPEVMEAVLEQLPKGMTFFANNAAGIELAEEIIAAVPCAEHLRFLSSGGEADMYAMRLARAFTGRDKILKFEGGYHGMSAEAQMSLAPTTMSNFPQAIPDSAGIPDAVRNEMLVAPFNNLEFLHSFLAEQGHKIAGLIIEPLQRIIPPEPGFLEAVRAACDKYGIILIFDEVVTGFRFSYGGAQQAYGVTPDLCTLGKVIGGGFPLAAIVGRKDIMAHFDKSAVGNHHWLMMLGTLSGNPVAAVSGLKTMEVLRRENAYDTLIASGERLMGMFCKHLTEANLAHQIVGHPTLFNIVFTDQTVRDYRHVQQSNTALNAKFNDVLRSEGIFKSAGKTYPSLALTEADFEQTNRAIEIAAKAVSNL
ncbi:MAG: aspartate aminotransferase family protein [Candidatus Puniceispirillales bacterium WSBS_2018_MAG_OTU23]